MENQLPTETLSNEVSPSGKKRWVALVLAIVLGTAIAAAYFLAGGSLFKGQLVTANGITFEGLYSSDANTVNLSWTDTENAANISKYIIYKTEGSKKEILTSLDSTNPKNYVDKNVEAGKTYTYSVRSMGKKRGEILADSGSITLKIDLPFAPPPPQTYANPVLSANLNVENQPVLKWTDDTPYINTASGQISKKIYNYSLSRGKKSHLSDLKWHEDFAAAIATFTDTKDLEPEVTYYYVLKTNGDGPSGEKVPDVAVSNQVGVAVPFFNTKNIILLSATSKKKEIKIIWTKENMPGSVELYTVYRSTESLPGSAVGPNVRGSNKNILKTFNDYGFDAPMVNGQTYFYKIVATVKIPGETENRKIVSNEISAVFQSE